MIECVHRERRIVIDDKGNRGVIWGEEMTEQEREELIEKITQNIGVACGYLLTPRRYRIVKAHARAALEVVEPVIAARALGEWKPIETAPRDGTPIEGTELYRYQPYKPEGQRQMKAPGRWQRWSGYGWENAAPPEAWKAPAIREGGEDA